MEGNLKTARADSRTRSKAKVPEVCQHHVIKILIKSTLMQFSLVISAESGFQRLGEKSRVDVSRRMPALDVGLRCLHSQGPTLPHRLVSALAPFHSQVSDDDSLKTTETGRGGN